MSDCADTKFRATCTKLTIRFLFKNSSSFLFICYGHHSFTGTLIFIWHNLKKKYRYTIKLSVSSSSSINHNHRNYTATTIRIPFSFNLCLFRIHLRITFDIGWKISKNINKNTSMMQKMKIFLMKNSIG